MCKSEMTGRTLSGNSDKAAVKTVAMSRATKLFWSLDFVTFGHLRFGQFSLAKVCWLTTGSLFRINLRQMFDLFYSLLI